MLYLQIGLDRNKQEDDYKHGLEDENITNQERQSKSPNCILLYPTTFYLYVRDVVVCDIYHRVPVVFICLYHYQVQSLRVISLAKSVTASAIFLSFPVNSA